jgi:hypothetical protein
MRLRQTLSGQWKAAEQAALCPCRRQYKNDNKQLLINWRIRVFPDAKFQIGFI